MLSKDVKGGAYFLLLLSSGLILYSIIHSITASSIPDGITTAIVGNTTKSAAAGGIANFSGNDTNQPERAGGFIFFMNISGETQNVRWKAFVGNASGKLTLEDSAGAVIYDWTTTTISGEVYTTRSSGNINWTNIGCVSGTGNNVNITEEENRLLNHSSKDDNITATFANTNNKAITVGTRTIAASQCRTLNIYVNSTTNPASVDTFEEVVLYDRNNTAFLGNGSDAGPFGNVVYAQTLETNQRGYNNQSTYDFQMLTPERGESSWASSTAYYFYIELS